MKSTFNRLFYIFIANFTSLLFYYTRASAGRRHLLRRYPRFIIFSVTLPTSFFYKLIKFTLIPIVFASRHIIPINSYNPIWVIGIIQLYCYFTT